VSVGLEEGWLGGQGMRGGAGGLREPTTKGEGAFRGRGELTERERVGSCWGVEVGGWLQRGGASQGV